MVATPVTTVSGGGARSYFATCPFLRASWHHLLIFGGLFVSDKNSTCDKVMMQIVTNHYLLRLTWDWLQRR